MTVLLIVLLVSFGGWKTKNLSFSGALSAFLLGCIISYFYHWKGLLLVGAFFLSSSIWSKLFSASKEEIEGRMAKTSVRDWQQVWANGGPAALFIILFHFSGSEWWLYSFAAAVAAANSDTWASEIGPLSRKAPLSIRSFKRVEKGTSGAVSVIGTVAALAGAAFISMLLFLIEGSFEWLHFILIGTAGFLGNIFDTVAGAFWQEEFTCPVCGSSTEAALHCGAPAVRSKGLPWMNNESVNLLSSFLAGIAVFLFISLL
ncbi:DUF92 domain-containing protein [Bacillus sp. Marseille-Q1617]|uniref:DUF92 domain-containing protein n=1 Tax=Bacillus sp. Marseille-Q1617 TaxID=2736887 RepID=UPI0020CA4FEE|nr:DUF92 domain-containing protein [Bacillus sp. Marseille-Q1617]